MDEANSEVIIIGAGLSGLACAATLERCGIDYILIEASDAVGGRMKTDEHRGFLLDRGFQVMLDSYPECHRFLDMSKLDLKAFRSGALVRFRGKLHRVADPWRDPLSAISTACSPVGTLTDKLQLAQMRHSLLSHPEVALLSRKQSTTLDALKARGFSDSMIERFFRPFFGGVFLEKDLSTSSRLFDYLFKMFSTGDACVPASGMQEIPRQIASRLNPSRLLKANLSFPPLSSESPKLTSKVWK